MILSGFILRKEIERKKTHIFCKTLFGIKTTTPYDFLCGERGRLPYYCHRHLILI